MALTISTIVCAYNEADYIGPCLQSLRRQTRPPDEILFGSETRKALDKALMELTPLQRLVFEMREVEGRATDEVADILSLPPGTVRVHLHRARMRLRALLSQHFRGAVA